MSSASERPRSLVKLVGIGSVVVLLLGTLTWIVVQVISEARREDTPQRYADLAEVLALPLVQEGQVAEQLSLAEQTVALHRVESRLKESAATCRDLARFARAHLDLLKAVRALQDEQPAIEGLFASVARTALGLAVEDHDLAKAGGTSTIDQLATVGGLMRRFKQLQVAAHANVLEFADDMPARFSGPDTGKAILAVKFIPQAGFFSLGRSEQDTVKLENVAGVDLHDCIVRVRLTGESGDTFTNVHFVRTWLTGTTKTASYESGVFGRTVDDPVRVSVTVWAKEMSAPPVTIKSGFFGW